MRILRITPGPIPHEYPILPYAGRLPVPIW